MAQTAPVVEKAKLGAKVRIGRVLGVVVAFMLFDGFRKLATEHHLYKYLTLVSDGTNWNIVANN